MKIYLDAIDESLFETITKGSYIPRKVESLTSTILVDIPKSDCTEDDKKKVAIEKRVMDILFQALDEDLFENVVHYEFGKESGDSKCLDDDVNAKDGAQSEEKEISDKKMGESLPSSLNHEQHLEEKHDEKDGVPGVNTLFPDDARHCFLLLWTVCIHLQFFQEIRFVENYVCPVFVDDDQPVRIKIRSGRHPVLESILQDNFVPNDTDLHSGQEYCQIVTGPNMGGKSCYIRQVALIAIMAQVGYFVPASYAKLHVLDGIYTRMGASDNIQQGRSTFLEELNKASQILQSCTSGSLVILDELGRGTSTHDGVAIAYATLHHLLEQKRCLVLFVTHYPKIADIQKEFPGAVGTYHVSYVTSNNGDSSSECKLGGSNANNEDVTYL
ncbi:hypothetical protein Droror1_Dr00011562 [Drosera rotundifolia]